jgi:hypothetical protein
MMASSQTRRVCHESGSCFTGHPCLYVTSDMRFKKITF